MRCGTCLRLWTLNRDEQATTTRPGFASPSRGRLQQVEDVAAKADTASRGASGAGQDDIRGNAVAFTSAAPGGVNGRTRQLRMASGGLICLSVAPDFVPCSGVVGGAGIEPCNPLCV